MADRAGAAEAAPIDPPTTWLGILRRIGPGIIITGSIVGSGELIVTTRLGAQVGFTLLWLVVLSCVVKVFLQIEIGRYVISSGRTALEAFNLVPGPRLRLGWGRGRDAEPYIESLDGPRAGWVVWCWAVMTFCTLFQLSGILLSLGRVFELSCGDALRIPVEIWALIIAAFTAILLSSGRYRVVERTTTLMVFCFTAVTVLAGLLLQMTDEHAIGLGDLAHGLSFTIPTAVRQATEAGVVDSAASLRDGLITAFGAFGITGVGASELVFYPYWCLEKGYAKFTGPRDDSPQWRARALGWIRVMKVDAWVSLVVYTVGTVSFYFLGAAVLHRRGEVPGDEGSMLETLSRMYTATFGPTSGAWLFLAGAFAVLFSTYFVATASNARLIADALSVFKVRRYADDVERKRMVRWLCVGLPVFCYVVQVSIDRPVALILTGAVAQASMLPFIAISGVYLRYRRTDPGIRQLGFATEAALILSALAIALVGFYQLWSEISK